MENGSGSRTNYLCSCHANWGVNGLMDSQCWHVDSIKRIDGLDDKIISMLESGLDEGRCMYFGSTVTMKEVEVRGSVKILMETCDSGVEGRQEIEVETRNGLIAIQLDIATKEDLMKRGCSLSKRWSL